MHMLRVKTLGSLKIVFNGSELNVEKGESFAELLKRHPVNNSENIIGVVIDGELVDIHAPINIGGKAEPVRTTSKQAQDILRHSTSHVMAQAVQHLYPNVKLAIGPAIKNGFYYDFDFKDPLSSEELEKIEKEMERLIKEDQSFSRFVKSRDEAVEFFRNRGEDYKVELIRDLGEEEEISFYQNGDFIDLCRGPHLPSTGFIKSFKLLNLAGAYWHGDERNPMLTRIYGTSFFSDKELRLHLTQIEEAKKRDHRKLGRELNLFSMH